MKFLLIVTSVFICSITGLFAADSLEGSEHRTFQVGQGSCHTVLFSVSKGKNTSPYRTMVFCDMGSSSRSSPTKLSFHNTSFDARVFKIKDDSEDDTQSSSDLSDVQSDSAQISGATSDTDMTTDHKEPFDVGRMISEIEDATNDVDNFIVMLTHPDKDHVNLYTDVFGNTQKPVLLICGGMWREHSTNEVLEILTNIEKRQNVYAVFPTYLDHLQHDEVIRGRNATTPMCNFHGNLLSFLRQYRNAFDYADHFQLTKKKVDKKTFEDLVLRNIYLWSVKHLSDDTNAQSLLFSCTLPDLQMSFVFTGDATPETFDSIPINDKDKLRTTYSSIPQADHKVCYVVPHHGAVGHYSQKACDLFQPDILLFSSGYVGSFNHPSKDTIKKYISYLKKLWKKHKTPFGKKYRLASEEYRSALYDETKQTYALKKPLDGEVVLLGTNVFGSILIKKDGVYVSGENKTPDGYYVDLRQCVASCTKSDILIDKKSGKIKKEFLDVEESAVAADIKFNAKSDEHGEFFSADKKKTYKLIKKSAGKKGHQNTFYLGIRVEDK